MSPVELTVQVNTPQSLVLEEGMWMSMSCKATGVALEANVSGPPGVNKVTMKQPGRLQETLEHISKRPG